MPVPLIVIGCIILLIAVFLAIRINVVVSYRDSLCVYARVLFVKIPIYPQKEKKKSLRFLVNSFVLNSIILGSKYVPICPL